MSAHRSIAAKGFTLVEILIVVVILGILAAIVIPQFTRASESAQAASVASQLQTIRSQVELYQVQHGGTPADLGTGDKGWDDMLTETSAGYGPYFQQAPRNPLAPSANANDEVAADTSGGWQWESGRIKAVVRDDENVIEALEQSGLVNQADVGTDEHGDFVVVSE